MALDAAYAARGARQLVVSLVGPPPAEFWTVFYDAQKKDGLSPSLALRRARRTLRKQDQRWWAGVMIWGVP